jgi:uncharacterized protein
MPDRPAARAAAFALASTFLAALAAGADVQTPPAGRLSPVPFTRVTIDDAFWAPRRLTNRKVSVPHQYEMCLKTGRIDAWRLQWKPGMEPVPHIFWDSDVAKWIESASYHLAEQRDPLVEAQIDDVVALMAKAQRPDGYLNSHFIQVEPELRFKNLGHWHELYCAGHLIEAAVAYWQATGKRAFLDVVLRYADLIDRTFGPGKRDGTSGHPEIELALVKLYRATGQRRWLDLALFFLNERGKKPSVFQLEMAHLTPEQAATNRAFFVKPDGSFNTEYSQDQLPVREQTVPVGHAVRAMYLYSGMADVGAETGDRSLVDACRRLWTSLTARRMYLTGGIGPSSDNEGFTGDYDLPNDTAYCETCASVGLVLWAHRLLQIERDGRYADVMERALYNGALAGIALDGHRFFYSNPLESRGDHHRQEWFGCACCPGNISRLLASLGGYLYSESPDGAFVHLYAKSEATLDLGGRRVVLRQDTRYPWEGRVTLTVEPEQAFRFALSLRVPGWARADEVRLALNGRSQDATAAAGYVTIRRQWAKGDTVSLDLPLPIERVHAHPAVSADEGRVALQRGPLVYCLEGADNPFPLDRVLLPAAAPLAARHEGGLLGGVTVIDGTADLLESADWSDVLYRGVPAGRRVVGIRAIPYYAWDHRAPGEMRVWLRAE